MGYEGIARAAGYFRDAVPGRVRRAGIERAEYPDGDRRTGQSMRYHFAAALRPATWFAAHSAGGNRRAEAKLHPKAGEWRVAGGLRADRAWLRLRCRRDAHARREARRYVCAQRVEAFHHQRG